MQIDGLDFGVWLFDARISMCISCIILIANYFSFGTSS